MEYLLYHLHQMQENKTVSTTPFKKMQNYRIEIYPACLMYNHSLYQNHISNPGGFIPLHFQLDLCMDLTFSPWCRQLISIAQQHVRSRHYEVCSIYEQPGSPQRTRTGHLVAAVYKFSNSYVFQDLDIGTVSDLLYFFFRAEIYFKVVITNQHYPLMP